MIVAMPFDAAETIYPAPALSFMDKLLIFVLWISIVLLGGGMFLLVTSEMSAIGVVR